ncbi:MAG: hypothetical protein KKD11_01835 [Candidatus Omnitrophica bacterium]|nr:hypothetical protein [Candidatus Omnitrophota bacterium]
MSYLIFCSFEVGGLPFKMAETLNRHGVRTYYISFAKNARGHDSTDFHYGKKREDWDISSLFDRDFRDSRKDIEVLRHIRPSFDITHCLATGHKAYLLRQAGMDYGYWCYGSDIDYYYKYFLFSGTLPIWKKMMLWPYLTLTFCREQRKSIIGSSSLMISPHQSENYKRLCPGKRLFFLSHLIDVMDYEELREKKKESKKRICEGIDAERFFFSSTRHFWHGKNRNITDCKGNDVILYSYARYLEISGDKDSKLILVKKGPDVVSSNRLIRELGINNYVVWVDEMRRDELSIYYQGASMCFGQFGTPSLTYTVLEPLSNGCSSVSFVVADNKDVPFYDPMPPVLNSKDPKEIADFMCKLTTDTEYADKLSYDSWLWAKGNCSEEIFVKTFQKEMS